MSYPNSNNNQEVMQPNPEDLQDSVEPPFALLRLNGFNSNNHHPCTTCGCSGSNPMKRRSPSSSSSFQDPLHPEPSCSEPNPKRLYFEPDDLTLRGFSKLSLPTTPVSSSPLRRSVSGPPSANAFVSPPMAPFADASGFQVQNPNPNAPQSPEQARTGVIPVTPPSNTGLPPLPPSLRRSASDPIPSPAKAISRSSSSGDVSEGLTKKETSDSKVESVAEIEESVFVEKVGEALTVNFKCPCGKGYQILLSGSDCFYKLM
ncbi:hypothetical protein FH972_014809 [Carpinus fangiana]|uniref:Uncharacterized protein n=1 Tax=Carpinus fangiana TaxID=176857 RepID=A0A5N6RBW8_9ROSI|nr:hypothetical protein FH972_014809 [Carpinus fangiana]